MDKDEGFLLIGTSIIILVALVLCVLAIMLIYQRRKSEHKKETEMINEQHIKELLATQVEIQQQTMEYIGREIHDSVGQKLTLASLYAQQIDYEHQYPQIKERISAVGTIINESLNELRSLSKTLTDNNTDKAELIELIQQEISRINLAGVCVVSFSSGIEKLSAPYTVKNIIIRIIQEFIQNSLKHAACSKIQVRIEQLPEGIKINAEDNGNGFDVLNESRKGIGLNNMKKRAAVINAVFEILSTPGTGTAMQLFIPGENFFL